MSIEGFKQLKEELNITRHDFFNCAIQTVLPSNMSLLKSGANETLNHHQLNDRLITIILDFCFSFFVWLFSLVQ